MRYFLVAGEPSGDIHASHLMRALCDVDPEASFRYIGGDKMREVAAGCFQDMRELAIMGFVEVLTHLRTIKNNLRACEKEIVAWKPDVVILVDFSGFNLKIAKAAHRAGFRVAYYILPKLWAWGAWRVKALRRDVDYPYAILPFERSFFHERGVAAEYLGNPLQDELPSPPSLEEKARFRTEHGWDERPIVALLPGSRPQELRALLPRLCMASEEFVDYQFVVAGTSALPQQAYQEILQAFPRVQLVMDRTHELVYNAVCAVVTSGTATLETGLMGTPQVVVYRGNALSIGLARCLVSVKWISLVNLILNKEAVVELIQEACTPQRIVQELREILPNGVKRERVLQDYATLRRCMGESGTAERVARSLHGKLLG
ncbi:MAG: lipid-A-disaccharide synthase [Bacteroides sp.]